MRLLLLLATLAACVHAPVAEPVAPPPASAVPTTSQAGPKAPADDCEAFNLEEAERARKNTGGCPYCPCACTPTGIVCAPCEACAPPRPPPDVTSGDEPVKP